MTTITKDEFPNLYRACDIISHDGGGGAGHRSYVIHELYPDQLDFAYAEEQLSALTEDQMQTLCAGDQDEADELRANMVLGAADDALNAFFNEGGCPVCDADRGVRATNCAVSR